MLCLIDSLWIKLNWELIIKNYLHNPQSQNPAYFNLFNMSAHHNNFNSNRMFVLLLWYPIWWFPLTKLGAKHPGPLETCSVWADCCKLYLGWLLQIIPINLELSSCRRQIIHTADLFCNIYILPKKCNLFKTIF